MIDTEKLRRLSNGDVWGDVGSALEEAADEIDRLRGLFRINMLFHANGATHEAIDRLLKGRKDVVVSIER